MKVGLIKCIKLLNIRLARKESRLLPGILVGGACGVYGALYSLGGATDFDGLTLVVGLLRVSQIGLLVLGGAGGSLVC